jgi:hypothetical protein
MGTDKQVFILVACKSRIRHEPVDLMQKVDDGLGLVDVVAMHLSW